MKSIRQYLFVINWKKLFSDNMPKPTFSSCLVAKIKLNSWSPWTRYLTAGKGRDQKTLPRKGGGGYPSTLKFSVTGVFDPFSKNIRFSLSFIDVVGCSSFSFSFCSCFNCSRCIYHEGLLLQIKIMVHWWDYPGVAREPKTKLNVDWGTSWR